MQKLADLANTKTYVLYDGECPMCRSFVAYTRFRETVGEVILLDCRQYSALLNDLKNQGYDLNNGMLLSYQGQLFYGYKAVNMMALLTSPSTLLNRFNAGIFKHAGVTKIVYPLLAFMRKISLKILGKPLP